MTNSNIAMVSVGRASALGNVIEAMSPIPHVADQSVLSVQSVAALLDLVEGLMGSENRLIGDIEQVGTLFRRLLYVI